MKTNKINVVLSLNKTVVSDYLDNKGDKVGVACISWDSCAYNASLKLSCEMVCKAKKTGATIGTLFP